MAILNVDILVKDDGSLAIRKVAEEAKKAESSTKYLKKSTDNLSSTFSSLKSIIAVVGFVELGRGAIKFADQMTTADSRLKLVTKSIEEQTKAHKELFSIAQQTRLGFKETADLYSRIAISTKDYNISQEKLLSITSTINKAMIVSGGTAESMNSAILQLGQAFSSNFQSVGQELGSIREQTPALYQAIVAGSGMTSKAFKQAAEDGELSTEIIIKALEKQANVVDRDFNKMLKTVGQSMTNMSNSIMGFVGFIDKSTGASSSLASSITSVSTSIDNFTKTLKNSNTELDTLAKKGNIKLQEDGILASILKVNQGAGDALYQALSETLEIVDKTAGEWAKIIDSSYSGMGKWVESVGMSLGVVEDKAKATKKAIDSIVPTRPNSDKYTGALVEDLADIFTRTPTKKEEEKGWEALYDKDEKAYKKAQDEKLKAQEKAQQDSDKLSEEWGKRKTDLTYSIAEAEQDAFSKPYIELEKKYQEDLEKYGKLQGAKELLTKEYQAKTEALNKETAEKFNKQEEEKYKKAAEWQVKLFDANEKINDQFIAQREKMYGATSEAQIESWYQNQLEWLGKLSLEGKATSEELQALLDKINGLKELKTKEQTLTFKIEKSFYNSFEDSLATSIENAFNGDGLNLKSFFDSIKKSLTSTIAGSFSNSIVNNFKTYTGFGTSDYAKGLSVLGGGASLVGTTVSASELAGIMNSGGKFDSATNTITTSGGTALKVGENGTGTVSSTGSDILGLANTVSTLKTAYSLLTTGISNSIMGGFNSIAGMTGIGGISEFGVGIANPFAYSGMSGLPSAMTAGSMASAGLIGGGIGYGVGSLGDMLFGADTKAGLGGALGGATGGILASLGVVGGPIGIIGGSLLGSILGGMFGTKKTTDTGYQFMDTASADNVNALGYQDWKKKSWFSSSKGTNFTELTEAQKKQISTMFEAYDYLLVQLGDNDKVFLDAGKYTGATFADQITKNFITAFTDVNQNLDSTIYNSWVEYATSVNKTVQEALATSVATFIQSKRTYEIWSLGDGVEALAKKAQFAKDDLTQLESMVGVTGITVENFLDRYNKAIKEGFTPETLTNWENLSTALMAATDAQKAYSDAIDAQKASIQSVLDAQKNANNTIYDTLKNAQLAFKELTGTQVDSISDWVKAGETLKGTSNITTEAINAFTALGNALTNVENATIQANEAIRQNTLTLLNNQLTGWITALGAVQSAIDNLTPSFKTFSELASTSITLDNYSSMLQNLEATRQNEITKLTDVSNTRLEQLNNEKSFFTSLADYIKELNQKIVNLTSTGFGNFFTDLADAKATLLSGGIPNTSNLTQSASSYLDNALQKSTSQLEYFREIAKVKDGLNGLGSMVEGGTLESIETAINAEKDTLKGAIDNLNNTALAILGTWKGKSVTQVTNTGGKIDAVTNDVVTKAYTDVLGRTADTAGYEYWTNQLLLGNITAENMKIAIANGALGSDILKAKNYIDGSHATGLDYVPFNGYRAELHKGERVQTASEVQKDTIITELKNEIKNLREITLKNAAETTRMSKTIDRVCPDGDALQVRITA